MKKVKFILPIIAATLLFSCDDYLDINESPNNSTADNVSPNLSLAVAQTAPYRTLTRNANVLGNLLMNNWGFNVNSFAVTNPEEFSLNFNNNTGSAIWDGLYVNTYALSKITAYESDQYDNHKAIAKILKSFYFQYLVDLYGDIPYFEVHQGTNSLTPSYDDGQVVYRDLVVQIEEAIAMIDNAPDGTVAVGSEDVMLGGNMDAWKRFGNTVKLRLLLRQSEMTDPETTSYLTAEFAELAGAEFVNQDVTINPGYSNNAEQQNPFFDLFYNVGPGTGATPAAQLASRETTIFRQYRASDWIADEINSNPVDARRGRLFTLIGGSVVGVIQGDAAQVSGGTAPTNLSALGPGVLTSSEQDGYVMTLAESKLLQAEAVLRNYLPGDAQALFNEGVLASFSQLGATPGAYITEVNGIPGKGLGSGTFEEKIWAISYQKNIALMGTNSIEAFIEATRTGYIDQIDLALGAVLNGRTHKPRRLLYPTSELAGNSANVPDISLEDIFVQGPFWFVNP